jgi:hypothetical protein
MSVARAAANTRVSFYASAEEDGSEGGGGEQ